VNDGRRSTTPTRSMISGSTPQLDTSVVSAHCVSMESVDKVGRREKFMQQTYDFHPGANTEDGLMNQSSISSAYREGGTNSGVGGALLRNAGAIERAREQRNAEQNRRREELHRRIEETRLKLQSDGDKTGDNNQQISHKSMKGSRSINDLSMFSSANTGGDSGRTSPLSGQPSSGSASAYTTLPRQHRMSDSGADRQNDDRGGSAKGGIPGGQQQQQDSGNLRRACSLSDLNKGGQQRRILPSTPGSVSGKKMSTSSRGDRSERRMSIKSPEDRPYSSTGGSTMSRLEQHERMLAARERERIEKERGEISSRNSNHHSQQRPRSAASTPGPEDPRGDDVPSYMRSTSASTRKEKVIAQQQAEKQSRNTSGNRSRIRRNSSTSKSVTNLSGIEPVDSSSEEEVRLLGSASKHQRQRARSQDRSGGHLLQQGQPGMDPRIHPGRSPKAYSHMDISQSNREIPQPIMKHSPSTDQPSQEERRYGRAKLKTTTIISNDGSVVMNQPSPSQLQQPEMLLSPAGSTTSDADDVTRSKLTRQLAQRTKVKVQEDAENLLKLYKRVSLDDDLEEEMRAELLSVLVSGASNAIQTLHLVCKNSATRTQGMGPSNQQEFGSNPYLQRMLENYSALMLPNQQNSSNNMKM